MSLKYDSISLIESEKEEKCVHCIAKYKMAINLWYFPPFSHLMFAWYRFYLGFIRHLSLFEEKKRLSILLFVMHTYYSSHNRKNYLENK